MLITTSKKVSNSLNKLDYGQDSENQHEYVATLCPTKALCNKWKEQNKYCNLIQRKSVYIVRVWLGLFVYFSKLTVWYVL